MSNKKYKLLKDLPWVKENSVFKHDGGICTGDFYYCGPVRITREFVESNPDMFQPIEDRIEVVKLDDFPFAIMANEEMPCYSLTISHEIPKEKFPLIKSAIERVLNGDDEKKEAEYWKKEFYAASDQLIKWIDETASKKYTKEQYDKAIEDAWNAAREEETLRKVNPICEVCGRNVNEVPLCTDNTGRHALGGRVTIHTIDKYYSFQDYLNHINKQK